jgi:nitrite reductase (NADH) small subunit
VSGRLRRVCSVADIPPLEGRSVSLGAKRIAIFRTARGYAALDGACPHRGGPLSDGILGEDCVVCPLHGWRVELETGVVLSGGEGRIGAYEVVERDGQLFVDWPTVVAGPDP